MLSHVNKFVSPKICQPFTAGLAEKFSVNVAAKRAVVCSKRKATDTLSIQHPRLNFVDHPEQSFNVGG